MKTLTVLINSDHLTLGPCATKEDFDTFCSNLATHLAERFPGKSFEIEPTLGGGRTPCAQDDSVDEYVRDLQSSDAWIELLEPKGTTAE